MPYKDRVRQKEAQATWVRQKRGSTKAVVVEPDVEPLVRLNPRDGKPYGPSMLALPAEAIDEYERKQTRPDILKVRELPKAQTDYLYRCLQSAYRSQKQGM